MKYKIQNTRIKHENKIQNKDNRYREMKAAFKIQNIWLNTKYKIKIKLKAQII